MAGSVSFKLRTTETDGLVMYNPGAGGTVSALTLIDTDSEKNGEYILLLGPYLLIIVLLVF